MSSRHLLCRASSAFLCSQAQARRSTCGAIAAWRAGIRHHQHPRQERSSSLSFPYYTCPLRRYATRGSADSHLVELLKFEIEHELHEEPRKQASLKGSAEPFEVLDKPGTEEVILKRNFANEQIAITCLVESEYQDEDEDPEEQNEKPLEVLHMNVNVTKGTELPALEIECSFMRGGSEIVIQSVSFLDESSNEKSAEKAEAYSGPIFEDLDENLQQAFYDLLKARGLSPRIAAYVLDYATVKEQREYMRWLHNLETFFTA